MAIPHLPARRRAGPERLPPKQRPARPCPGVLVVEQRRRDPFFSMGRGALGPTLSQPAHQIPARTRGAIQRRDHPGSGGGQDDARHLLQHLAGAGRVLQPLRHPGAARYPGGLHGLPPPALRRGDHRGDHLRRRAYLPGALENQPYHDDLQPSSLAELGLDSFPPTYSTYLQAAQQYQKDLSGDGYTDQWFGNTSVKLAWYQRLFNFYPLYLAASGGKPLIEDGRAAFHNEHAIGAFRFLQELYRENYFSRQAEGAGQDLFVAGRYASKWTGPWEVEYLEKFKREGFEYDFCPMPVPDGHEGPIYTYGDPKSIVVFNTCQDPQLAFEFIKIMVDEEGDLEFLRRANQLPRRQGIDAIPSFQAFFEQNPKLQAFAQQARYVKGADICASLIEVFDILSQEYEACVLYQIKSPEQAIADAERAVNVLLRAPPVR
jgi:hypothetical protein